jgi:hypothetical protein
MTIRLRRTRISHNATYAPSSILSTKHGNSAIARVTRQPLVSASTTTTATANQDQGFWSARLVSLSGSGPRIVEPRFKARNVTKRAQTDDLVGTLKTDDAEMLISAA